MKLTYFWRVYFRDGTVFAQFDFSSGKENAFKPVLERLSDVVKAGWYPFTEAQANLLRYRNYPFEVESKRLPHYEVHISSDKRLILLRQRFVTYTTAPARILREDVIYLLGWQETIKGRNRKCIMFIHPDGSVELASEFEEMKIKPKR